MEYPSVIRNSVSLKFKDSSRKNDRESTLFYTNRPIATQNSGRCHQSQGYDSFPNAFRKNYSENLQQFDLASLVNPISGDNVKEYQSNINPTNKLVYEAEINPAKRFNQYGPHKKCSYNARINKGMKDSLNVDKFNPVCPKSLIDDVKLRETDSSRRDASNRKSKGLSYVLLNKERKDSYNDGKFDRDRVNNLVDVRGKNCSKEFSNYVSKDIRLKDPINGYKFNNGCTDNLIDETGFSWTKRSSLNALNSRYSHYVPKDRHLKDPISVLKTKMVNMPTKTRFRQASLEEFIGDINTLPKIKTKKAKRKENSIQQSKENC